MSPRHGPLLECPLPGLHVLGYALFEERKDSAMVTIPSFRVPPGMKRVAAVAVCMLVMTPFVSAGAADGHDAPLLLNRDVFSAGRSGRVRVVTMPD